MLKKLFLRNSKFVVSFFSIIMPLIYLLFSYLYPMYKIIIVAFGYGFGNTGFTISYFINLFHQNQFVQALYFTFQQALITTFLALILGLPAGYFLARYEFPLKNAIQDLITIPFLLPSVVMLLGLVLAFGPNGFVTLFSIKIFGRPLFSLYGTLSGIIIAHLIYNLSVVIRVTETGWRSISAEEEAVAKTLGASHYYYLYKITLPKIISYVKTAVLLVFIYCFNSFAIVLALGEVRYKTLEVLIYENARIRLRFHLAAALTVIQLILNIIIITIYLKQGKNISETEGIPTKKSFFEEFSKKDMKHKMVLLVWIFYMAFILFLSLIPIYAVIKTSFYSVYTNSFTFENYKLLFSQRYEPLLGTSLINVVRNSLIIAVSVTAITLVLSIPIARYLALEKNTTKHLDMSAHKLVEEFLSLIIILPMATSAVSLSLGVALAYKNTKLYNNYVGLLIIIAQTLVAFPFVYRIVFSRYEQLSIEQISVAKTLGGTFLYIFKKIELPHLLPAILTASIFSFAISLGEFGATYFLARTEWTTMSIAVYKLIISRNPGLPSAMASLMIFISFVAFRLISSTEYAELRV